jgi:hypothetical protein
MKRIAMLALFIVIMLVFTGCQFSTTDPFNTTTLDQTTHSSSDTSLTTTMIDSQNTSTITSITSSLTTTTQVTTSSTTTQIDLRVDAIEAEFAFFESTIPAGMKQSFLLPTPTTSDFEYSITVTGALVENQFVIYTKFHDDVLIEITVEITYQELSITKEFIIIMLRDQATYEQYLIDEKLHEIDQVLRGLIPEVAISDFSIPKLTYEQTTFQYSVSTSYIYDGRFIFPFPTTGEMMMVTVRVNHKNTIRFFEYAVYMQALNELPKIPVVTINTLNSTPITSKEEYIPATLSMVSFNEDDIEIPLILNASLQIRGRGNSSWSSMPKKSYRLKFDDSVFFLTTYKEKDWNLIANFADHTLIRNFLAYNLSRSMNMDFSPTAQFIDLYLNGEYLGNYMVTDQIEISKNRVNIEKNSTDLNTGYIIELDQRLSEPNSGGIYLWNYFNIRGYMYAIKDPNPTKDHYSINHLYYIESYFLDVHLALQYQQPYHQLIDEASFVDWFIINELFKNVDVGFSSVYFTKDRDGLLKMGPVWDFDLSTSNQGHVKDYNLRGPIGWYTPLQYKNIWFYFLMQSPTFTSALKARWNEVYNVQLKAMMDSINPTINSIAQSRYQNFQRWNTIGSWWDWYTSPEVYDAKTYEAQVKLLRDYLNTRLQWMNEQINNF